jgi:hypothetical protein
MPNFTILDWTFKGVADLKLRRRSDGLLINAPIPSTFRIENGIEQVIQNTKNSQGENVRSNSYIRGRMPTMSIAYSHMSPELLAFRIGNYFETMTVADLGLPRTYDVEKNEYPPVSTGKLGFTIAADEPSVATVTVDHISTPLTQGTYAGFTPATLMSFAIGASGAVKFSDDLVAAKARVSIETPYTITGLGIGSTVVGTHSVSAVLIGNDNEVVLFKAGNVTPNFDGSGFDAGADTLEIPWFVNNVAGSCQAWNLYFCKEYVSC